MRHVVQLLCGMGRPRESAARCIVILKRVPLPEACLSLTCGHCMKAYCGARMAPADMAVSLQMLDLPPGAEGLAWIVQQGPGQLLLIPGVQPASIAAAAMGDQQALVSLRFTAQQHAAGLQTFADFEDFERAASRATAWPVGKTWQAQLKVAYRRRLDFTEGLILDALESGQLAAFRWLQALCHPIEFEHQAALMTAAATGGHLKILQFLRSGPDPAAWDEDVSSEAAGHLDCLKWLLTQDPPCPCDDRTIARVAFSDNLDALKWLRTLPQIPLDWWTADSLGLGAICRENLEMLKWLRTQDPPCPWARNACVQAAVCGNLEMLRWMRAQEPPCPWDGRCLNAAAGYGHIQMLEWISAQYPICPWGPQSSDAAAARGRLEALEFLHSHGCSVAGSAYCHAARENRRHVLKWLHDHRIPAPSHVPEDGSIFSTPMLMFLGDIGALLPNGLRARLQAARQTFCAFHGLLRWCRSAVSDPSRGAHRAFDYLSDDSSGQELLVLLSRLPLELVSKIAVAADLQHDVFQ